jgi:hypothetical protein
MINVRYLEFWSTISYGCHSHHSSSSISDHTQHTGSKRKRQGAGVHRGAEEGSDPTVRAELKRLRKENKQMAQENKRLMESIDMVGLTASIQFLRGLNLLL